MKSYRENRPYIRSDGGYTLLELLVVLAILAILAAVATPAMMHYLDTAKLDAAKTEVSNLSAALDVYKLDVGRYPTTAQGLRALLVKPPRVKGWDGPYLKRASSLNDPWGQAFHYISPGRHGPYDLFSYGANGKSSGTGTAPPISNW